MRRLPREQQLHDRFSRHVAVPSYIGEDSRRRADAQLSMAADRDVVFAMLLRRQPHVAARLTRYLIPQRYGRPGEPFSRETPGALIRQ